MLMKQIRTTAQNEKGVEVLFTIYNEIQEYLDNKIINFEKLTAAMKEQGNVNRKMQRIDNEIKDQREKERKQRELEDQQNLKKRYLRHHWKKNSAWVKIFWVI